MRNLFSGNFMRIHPTCHTSVLKLSVTARLLGTKVTFTSLHSIHEVLPRN